VIPANFPGRPGDRVYIAWMRAEERDGWMALAEAKDEKPSIVETTGFLLAVANGGVVICSQRDTDSAVVDGVVAIPVGSIVDGPHVLTSRNDRERLGS